MSARIVVLSIVLLAVLGPVVVLVRDGRPSPVPSDTARRALRHVTLASTVAAVSLSVTLALVVTVPLVGGFIWRLPARASALLPALALVWHLGVLLAGELTLPRPTGAVREARVVRRATADVTTTRDRHLLGAWAATLVGTAATLTLASSGPRTISRLVGPAESSTAGPFPGWLWTLPAAATVPVALVAVLVVARAVAARSALPGVDPAWDLWLRRRVARRALRSAQLVLGATVAGLLLVAGFGLVAVGGGGDGFRAVPPSLAHQVAGQAVMVSALAVCAVAVACALWPARDPAPAPTPAADLPAVAR